MSKLKPFVRFQGKWYRRNRLWGVKGILGPAARFTWAEVRCTDGTDPAVSLRPRIVRQAQLLNSLRAVIAKEHGLRNAKEVKIKVNSWYRSPSYNRSIGGATLSQHVDARATDINVRVGSKALTPLQVAASANKVPAFHRGGIGVYDAAHGNFTHLDHRPDGPARWSNG